MATAERIIQTADDTQPTGTRPCECSCDCGEAATTTDDSDTPVCDECSHWYEGDGCGEVICRRMQDDTTCRHCGEDIEWGRIQTDGMAGNYCDGSCGCDGRIWTKIECGGEWRFGESMHDDSGEDGVAEPADDED